MRKNIISIFLLVLLMTNLMPIIVRAEEEETTEEAVQTEQIVQTESETQSIQNVRKTEVVKAKITEVIKIEDVETGSMKNKTQYLKAEILEGENKGKEVETTYILSYDIDNKILAYELSKGNKVFLQINTEPDGTMTTQVQDVERQNYIISMIVVFFLIILIVGRKQGLKAIIALVVTILAIYFIMIMSIYHGYNAVLMSILTSIVIIAITFWILSGINKKSITAALGTLGGVILAGIMAFIFGYMAKLSGVQEESIFLTLNAGHVVFNFKELLFAGIVISSLGATMDVGMSIASSLDEIKSKTREISWKELFKSGMNIGGDMIGTMTNTLILAYVGGTLNLILLFLASDASLMTIINKEAIATDIVSALAGSMGVVFTVPTTSIIYALMNKDKTHYKVKSDNKINGKRSLKL